MSQVNMGFGKICTQRHDWVVLDDSHCIVQLCASSTLVHKIVMMVLTIWWKYMLPTGGLTFAERLAQHTPDLVSLRDDYNWTDEDSDDGEMEPMTHNKIEVCPEVTGSSLSCLHASHAASMSFAMLCFALLFLLQIGMWLCSCLCISVSKQYYANCI